MCYPGYVGLYCDEVVGEEGEDGSEVGLDDGSEEGKIITTTSSPAWLNTTQVDDDAADIHTTATPQESSTTTNLMIAEGST